MWKDIKLKLILKGSFVFSCIFFSPSVENGLLFQRNGRTRSHWWLLRGWRARRRPICQPTLGGKNKIHPAKKKTPYTYRYGIYQRRRHSCRHCYSCYCRRYSRAALLVRQSGASLAILMRTGQLRSIFYPTIPLLLEEKKMTKSYFLKLNFNNIL